MKKKFILFILLILALPIQKAYSDTVVLQDGTQIEGRIDGILSDFVEIKTPTGLKQVHRKTLNGEARDIVEIGFFKKSKVSGEIFLLNKGLVEMRTPSGNLQLNRLKVRNIVLSQPVKIEDKEEFKDY